MKLAVVYNETTTKFFVQYMKHSNHNRTAQYKKNSLSLAGAVSMGTAVIIGAGIFALTGQIAELAGPLFPLIFLVGAIVTAFSAYSYVRLASTYPSAGGIAMFLKEAYGMGTITAFGALLMYFSMVINESLVARTFGTYTLQLFDVSKTGWLVSLLGVGLLIFAFIINILGNKAVSKVSLLFSIIKIGGITSFALAGLWLSGFSFASFSAETEASYGLTGSIAAVALAILAYKGFTTITNSGSEIKKPHKNVGRAIIISLVICVLVYFLVALAVAGNLLLPQIIQAKNFALAEAARPAFGSFGLWFTVLLAVVATISSVIASSFAVSRMLAMLTEMKLVPHRHFKLPGDIQTHTLVYTIVVAIFLTIFFDLSRIASLGAIFYLIMDMMVHWGLLTRLKDKVNSKSYIVITAIILDVVVLGAFVFIKFSSDPLVIYSAVLGLSAILGFERFYLRNTKST